MNSRQARFEQFFHDSHNEILTRVASHDPNRAVRRTRGGFAAAYRFWPKVEADGDPVRWVERVIADDPQRRHLRNRRGEQPVDAVSELRRVVSLARRQRTVAHLTIGSCALALLATELLAAHR